MNEVNCTYRVHEEKNPGQSRLLETPSNAYMADATNLRSSQVSINTQTKKNQRGTMQMQVGPRVKVWRVNRFVACSLVKEDKSIGEMEHLEQSGSL